MSQGTTPRNPRFVLSSDIGPGAEPSSDISPDYNEYEVMELDDRMEVEQTMPILSKPKQEPELQLTFEEYVSLWSLKSNIIVENFCRLSPEDQKKIVFHLENLPLDAYECRELPEKNLVALLDRLRNGTEKRTVYTSHLEDATVVGSASCFPPIGEVQEKEAVVSSLLDDVDTKWYEWINSRQLYSLEQQSANFAADSFRPLLDADATVLHSDSLKVLKQSFSFYVTPKYNSWASKIKHLYKDTTLHNVVNAEIGLLESKWKVYVCFLDCPKKSFPNPKDLVNEFYYKFLTGMTNGPQAGDIDIWKHDVRGYIASQFNKGRDFSVDPSSIPAIELQIDNFTYRGQRIRLCFTFQYFGKKQIFNREGFAKYLSRAASAFKLDEIMDPDNHLFDNTLFFQDIAFTISPPANYKNMLSLLWSPEYIKKLGVIMQSPLSNLLVYNERHPQINGAKVIRTDGTNVSYPNLGIGQMTSCMIDWRSTQYAIREIKAYCSASQIWRNNAPYDETCYSVGAVPFDVLLSGTEMSSDLQKHMITKAESIGESFAMSNELENIERIVKSLTQSTAGIRLEVTFQNLGVGRLMEAYDELERVANRIVKTHLSLEDLIVKRFIPEESLRFSPVQLVSSNSVALLCGYQAKNLHTMFDKLHAAAIKDKTELHVEVINALSLLEDLQQFLWSGSIPTLHNPSLFKNLHTVGWLSTYNKIYVPASVFSFNWHDLLKTKCDLPLDAPNQVVINDEEEDARNILAPQLGLTKRFLYQAFKLNAGQLTLVSDKLIAAVKLHADTKSNLFQPLYKSKSMLLATNLLNLLFETCFVDMEIKDKNRLAAMEVLRQPKKFTWRTIRCSEEKTTITALISGCFPIKKEYADSIKGKRFLLRWQQVHKEVANLSREMHFNNFRGTDDKRGSTYPVHPAITIQNVMDQMVILLFHYQLYWLPAIGQNVFVSKVGEHYLVDKVTAQFKSPLIISALNTPHGAALPHPVDNSFIFMMAKKIAKRIEKERDEEIRQLKIEAGANEEQKRGRNKRPVPKLFHPDLNLKNLQKYNADEIIGHILFQYCHRPLQAEHPNETFNSTVRYGNVPKKVLLSTGMLRGPEAARSKFETVSANDIWQLYQEQNMPQI